MTAESTEFDGAVMDALLLRVQEGLVRLDRRVLLAALCPGVSGAHTRSLLEASVVPSSPQLEALFHWRNGTELQSGAALGDLHLFPGFYFLSVEDAVADYQAFVSDPRWSPGWLPVFANGGGDFYVVDLAGAGEVRHFRVDASEHPVEFLSLESMLYTIAAGFERGVFFVDEDGYLEMDDVPFGSLSAVLNLTLRGGLTELVQRRRFTPS